MMKKISAIALVLCMVLPVAGIAEDAALPFGLTLGMDAAQTEAAIAADATLSAATCDKEDYGSSINYVMSDIAIPDTDVVATSVEIQVDQNNSEKADKLTSVSLMVSPAENSIATFRTILAAMTAKYGAPSSDPFGADAADSYVEWGSLTANWTFDDLRVSLSLSRMYEESVAVQFSSRKNYDAADLAE